MSEFPSIPNPERAPVRPTPSDVKCWMDAFDAYTRAEEGDETRSAILVIAAYRTQIEASLKAHYDA